MGLFPQPRTGPLPAGPIGDKKHQGLPCTVAWLWAPTCGTGASHSQACRAGVAAVSPECCEPGHPQFPVPRWVPRWKHSISHFGRAAGAGEAGLALRSIQRKTIPGAHQPAASMPVRRAVRSQQPSTLQSPSPPQPSRTSMNTMSPTWPGHDASQVMGRVPSWQLPWAAATTRLFTPCILPREWHHCRHRPGSDHPCAKPAPRWQPCGASARHTARQRARSAGPCQLVCSH